MIAEYFLKEVVDFRNCVKREDIKCFFRNGIKCGGEIFLSKSISIGKDDLNIRYDLLNVN